MIVYLLRKLVVLFCCCLLALSAHVHECVTGKEQTVLDSKNSGTFADDEHTEEVCIDESLLLWKERLHFKQQTIYSDKALSFWCEVVQVV